MQWTLRCDGMSAGLSRLVYQCSHSIQLTQQLRGAGIRSSDVWPSCALPTRRWQLGSPDAIDECQVAEPSGVFASRSVTVAPR